MAASFVTNYGHPENNGLSFASPKRTINQAGVAGSPTYMDGYFNENTNSQNIVGVNSAILSYVGGFTNTVGQGIIPTTLKINSTSNVLINAIFTNCEITAGFSSGGGGCIANNVLAYNMVVGGNNAQNPKSTTQVGTGSGAVFYYVMLALYLNHYNIISNFLGTAALNGVQINTTQVLAKSIQYVLFHKCSFRFQLTGGSSNETAASSPTGATDQLKLDNLKTRMATVYGGAPDDYLVGCKYTDDADTTIFIDPARNNYYLVPNSLPTKMSYDGKYIGARPEGSFIAFNSSNFTYSNFDENGNIVDQRIDATATSSIVDMLQIRTINRLDSLGQLAARNGNELNLTETILPNPLIYSDALTLNRTYKVYNGSIIVGTPTYNIGDCFIAKGTSFLSGSDTYAPTGITAGTLLVDLGCYEVENNSVTYMGVTYTTGQRFQCYYDSANTFTGTGTLKRFMGGFVRLLSEYYGNTGIVAGTTLRYMQTYEVVGGTSVSYNSVVYTPGQRFTALSTPTTFTAVGGSTLSEWNIGYPKSLDMKVSKTDATLSTDTWVKMHLTDTPIVNVDINGKVTHGNLDSGFNRATAVALSCRYWQCRLTVQSLNIPY